MTPECMDVRRESEVGDLMEASCADARDKLIEFYPNITSFMGAFRVHLGPYKGQLTLRKRRFKDSIFIFKKKRLSRYIFESNTDIYATSIRGLELDTQDENKSRSSCGRCRRYKKKCTRDLPECLNCSVSDELCVYRPRKKRSFLHSLDCDTGQTSPVLPTPSGSGMYLIDGQIAEFPAVDVTANPRQTQFEQTMSNDPTKILRNTDNRNSSDLMKLLN